MNTKQDQLDFQASIDAVYEWSQKWEMPFNVTKCHAMAFNSRPVLPDYSLGKLDKHISEKVDKASRILGAIKHTIRTAPEKSKLMAYTSLCRPIMEYADILWDSTDK